MKKTEGLKYHKIMLDIIDEFKKAKWGKLLKKNSPLDGSEAYVKAHKKGFSVEFKSDFLSPNKKNLDVGQYHNNILIEHKNSALVLEATEKVLLFQKQQ